MTTSYKLHMHKRTHCASRTLWFHCVKSEEALALQPCSCQLWLVDHSLGQCARLINLRLINPTNKPYQVQIAEIKVNWLVSCVLEYLAGTLTLQWYTLGSWYFRTNPVGLLLELPSSCDGITLAIGCSMSCNQACMLHILACGESMYTTNYYHAVSMIWCA